MMRHRPDRPPIRQVRRLTAAALIACAALATAAPAAADDHDDHDRARAALADGAVLPLDRLLAIVAADFPGDVLEVELERDDGAWLYEMVVLRADGAVLEIELDAATGAVLAVEGDRLEGPGGDDD